jgi:hypothetical protein
LVDKKKTKRVPLRIKIGLSNTKRVSVRSTFKDIS